MLRLGGLLAVAGHHDVGRQVAAGRAEAVGEDASRCRASRPARRAPRRRRCTASPSGWLLPIPGVGCVMQRTTASLSAMCAVLRQQFGELDAGDVGVDRLEGAAVFGDGLGLGVEGVHVRHAALLEDHEDIASAGLALLFGSRDLGKGPRPRGCPEVPAQGNCDDEEMDRVAACGSTRLRRKVKTGGHWRRRGPFRSAQGVSLWRLGLPSIDVTLSKGRSQRFFLGCDCAAGRGSRVRQNAGGVAETRVLANAATLNPR